MPGIFRSTDPTVWDDIDGIYINEVTPPPSVVGAAANVAILVGQTERGLSALTELAGTQDFYERFGRNSSFGAHTALLNKKMGRIKLIRVVASDAVVASKTFDTKLTFTAKQGAGVYGNSLQVKIEQGSSSRQEKHTITCVADDSDDLDGTFFTLPDEVGTVGFWIDTDDSGTSAPTTGADRDVEISTIVTDDDDETVASKIAAVINADSKFSAVAVGAVVTVTCLAYNANSDSAAANTSGFTIAQTVVGVDSGKKYTVRDNGSTAQLPVEVFDDVKIASITSFTFSGSLLISVAVVDDASGEPADQAYTALESGADGTVADTDYETAIALAAVEKAGNVIFLDSYNDARNVYLKTHVAATTDKIAVLGGSSTQTFAEWIADLDNYRDTDGRMIYPFGWVETLIGGVLTYTSPTAWIGSILSQTTPYKSLSAVENASMMAAVTSLKTPLTRAQQVQADAAGGLTFEFDEDFGYLVKNAVTTQIANSEKRTILRRRMTDYLTSSMGTYLKNYSNAVNSQENRIAVKGAMMDFINRQEVDGILPKDSEVENGVAKLVDTESLNTNSSIGQGFFKIAYKQRIYSSMRYIVLSIEVGTSVVVTEQAA
jgi:hypothetical protein